MIPINNCSKIMVRLKSCANAFEAEVIKARLESEGIPCVLNNTTMNHIYGGVCFDVDIMVREADAEKAQALIGE